MIDLKQKELYEWQSRNFPRERYLVLSKEQLVDIIYTLQVTLGICEEAGEVAHHVLKGIQGIREGINGIDKEQVADGIADTLVYGQQLASELKIDLETEIPKVIDSVLVRNWIDNKVDAMAIPPPPPYVPIGPLPIGPLPGSCACRNDWGCDQFDGLYYCKFCGKLALPREVA